MSAMADSSWVSLDDVTPLDFRKKEEVLLTAAKISECRVDW